MIGSRVVCRTMTLLTTMRRCVWWW